MRKDSVLSLMAAMLALAGCSLAKPMTAFSVDYNRVVADARSRTLLLNIVRAKYREPTQFTAVTQINGRLTAGASMTAVGSNIFDAGPGGDSVSVALTGDSSPDFQIVPLTSKEFTEGFLRPLDPNIIRLLIGQGWDTHLLMPLLVGRVDCPATTRSPAFSIANDVDRYQPLGDGRVVPGAISGLLVDVDDDDAPTPSAPEAASASAGSDGSVTLQVNAAQAAELVLKYLGDGFDTIPTPGPAGSADAAFRITPKADMLPPVRLNQSGVERLCATAPASSRQPTAQFGEAHAADVTTDGVAHVHVRSIESIMNYLGSLLRTEAPVYYRTGTGEQRVLFRIQIEPIDDPAISVRHHGVTHAIPRWRPDADDDRTLSVIALVNNLIALQISDDSLERIPTSVRLR